MALCGALRAPPRVAKSRALVLEQPSLALDPAAIARERAIGADDAMAWDHEADRIGAVGVADRAHRPRTAEFCGERAVAQRRARRDAGEPRPDSALERR